ncbi:CLUMA_CG007043, isoform A [Clunio marinus]|uniref:CLUMA_CG007043, isoform A n=1 Tax=Clunio marinus TaxID=568069 RepID=A0A1J1HZW4_9DIPT|nr:CLUMA_CG007043, isoform A [Clunio marinus]
MENTEEKPVVKTSEYCRSLDDLQATALSINYNGTFLLLAGRRHLAVQNLENKTEPAKMFHRNSKFEVSCAEFAICQHSSNLCAIATSQLIQVVTWKEADPLLEHSLRAHTRVVTDIDWHSHHPYMLATCSIDTFTHLWDLRDPKKPILSLSAVCMSGATQVGFNRVSGHLIATAHDGDLRIWDIRKGSRPVQYITAHLNRIHGINWSHEQETHLVTSSQDGSVKFFDINNPRRAERIITTPTPSPVWRARYTPPQFKDGLVTIIVPHLGSSDSSENSLLLWNNSKNSQGQSTPVCSFEGHTDVILDFAYRNRRGLLYDTEDLEICTWSRDQTFRVWKLDKDLQKLCTQSSIETENGEVALDYHQGTSVQPSCSLQHELSLIFFPNIPGVQDYECDPVKRNAMIRIAANGYIIDLQVIFPSGYPVLNQPPVFEFCQNTSLDENLSLKLMKVLKETASSRVRKGRTCLEQCLRNLVIDLKKESGGDKAHLRLQSPRLEGALSGVLDACIPFPRTSGVRFNAVGMLVTFTRPFTVKRFNLRNQTTPRALSALSGGYLGNVNGSKPVFYAQRENALDRQKSRSISTTVCIYDASKLFLVNREIAENYLIDPNNIPEMCRHNRKVAEDFGRPDLVQCWSLAEMVATSNDDNTTSDDEMFSTQNPFAKNLLESLIMHFAKICDVQTAAMLCVTFGRYCQEISSRTSSFSTKSNTSQSASPYHTVTAIDTNSQATMKYNARLLAQHLKGQTRSNSWSESLADDYKINEITRSLLGDSNRYFYDTLKKSYADILYCFGLLPQRAQVLKYLSVPPSTFCSGVEYVTECQTCRKTTRGPSCLHCKKYLLYCSLCQLPVRGAANACLSCGHGGHTAHLIDWFNKYDVCPTCGCRCIEKSGNILEL